MSSHNLTAEAIAPLGVQLGMAPSTQNHRIEG